MKNHILFSIPNMPPTKSCSLLFIAADVIAVYLSAVFLGAPLLQGWYWTAAFAMLCTALNVAPRTMVGMAPIESRERKLVNAEQRRSEKVGSSPNDLSSFVGVSNEDGTVECEDTDFYSELASSDRFYITLPKGLHISIVFKGAVFVAASAGAIVSPLDAENWWQYWPLPSLVLTSVVTLGAILIPFESLLR